MKRLFLGVDGGQSGTVALIADEDGRILGRGSGGPCNHVSASEAKAKFVRVVRECVGVAVHQAGLGDAVNFEAACFGMSGGPEDKEGLLRELIQSKQWLVTNDAVIALSGALAGEPGVITIAGTGSIALARSKDGQVRRAGGWGYVYGDEGGAFDIVREAVRAGLRAEEGWGPATRLRDVLMEQSGCGDMNSVVHLFYTPEWPRSRVATLARYVDEAGAEGDQIAAQILAGAAQDLATVALAVRRELVNCSYVGGVFQSAAVLERYRALLELSGCRVVAPSLGPAAGALVEAYSLVGLRALSGKLLSSEFRNE